jgi:hypothetical protein
VQVKTFESPRREDRRVDPTYAWTLKRGRSADVTQRYHRDDIEVFALVALDVRKICFQRPGCPGYDVDTKVRLLPFVFTREDITENSLARCLAELA